MSVRGWVTKVPADSPALGLIYYCRIIIFKKCTIDLHLSHHDQDVPVICPHPSCDISLQDVNHFKNHISRTTLLLCIMCSFRSEIWIACLLWRERAVTRGAIGTTPVQDTGRVLMVDGWLVGWLAGLLFWHSTFA